MQHLHQQLSVTQVVILTVSTLLLATLAAMGVFVARHPNSLHAQAEVGAVVATPMATDSLHLPWVVNRARPVAARLGYGLTGPSLTQYADWEALNAGWYLNWSIEVTPTTQGGIAFAQVVRVHQRLACGVWRHSDREACPYAEPHGYVFRPNAGVIVQAAQANPGALWLIGNEMDRRDWAYCRQWDGNHCLQVAYDGQDEMLPETYAVAFHELAELIRSADPTAKIAIGGVIQATPLRLAYLTSVWDAYLARYGEPMPVDVWNVHNFILQEKRNSWGADTPPGAVLEEGAYIGDTRTHIDMGRFAEQIRAFRHWMKERGQQEKPLIVSEYGVLYANYLLGLPAHDGEPIHDFMVATFDHFLHTRDCTLGYPPDDCRLVQRWNWFSLDDHASHFNPHGRLYDPETRQMLPAGDRFRHYMQANLNLLADGGY